jgi:hypothetical protein
VVEASDIMEKDGNATTLTTVGTANVAAQAVLAVGRGVFMDELDIIETRSPDVAWRTVFVRLRVTLCRGSP